MGSDSRDNINGKGGSITVHTSRRITDHTPVSAIIITVHAGNGIAGTGCAADIAAVFLPLVVKAGSASYHAEGDIVSCRNAL